MSQLICTVPIQMVIEIDLDDDLRMTHWGIEKNCAVGINTFLQMIGDNLREKCIEGIKKHGTDKPHQIVINLEDLVPEELKQEVMPMPDIMQ